MNWRIMFLINNLDRTWLEMPGGLDSYANSRHLHEPEFLQVQVEHS